MKKILLVEDSRALRTLVSRQLREKGWVTLEADDGREGILLALQHRPELVLLDVAMPILDGPSTLQRIRNKESIRNTPVIMMTASADRPTVVKLARLGIQDYIVKPFNLALLLSKVEAILGPSPGVPVAPIEEPAPPRSPQRPEGDTSVSSKGSSSQEDPAESEKTVDSPLRPNLLLVGLSFSALERLRQVLSSRFDFFTAADFETAVRQSVAYAPHAVIFDLNNDAIEPVDLYKRLKYMPHLLHTPFIAIRHSDPEHQEKAERIGMLHFLAEPIEPEHLTLLFEALDRERKRGQYGENYVHFYRGYPVLKWPEDLPLEKLQQTTYSIEDNLVRYHDFGQRRMIIQVGALRRMHDGHFRLMLAIRKKALQLNLDLAFVTQNPIAIDYFGQYVDTRNIVFRPSIDAAISEASA